jgi:hypothetical protein
MTSLSLWKKSRRFWRETIAFLQRNLSFLETYRCLIPNLVNSIPQYKYQLKKWKAGKHIKNSEMRAIVRKRQHRKMIEHDKRPLQFTKAGEAIDMDKVNRWMKRHGIGEFELYGSRKDAASR